MLTVLITILVCSLIITLLSFIKEVTEWENIDLLILGPVGWIWYGIVCIIRRYRKHHPKEEKPYKNKSKRKISQIVKRVIKGYKKIGRYEYFDFTRMYDYDGYYEISGWHSLLTSKVSAKTYADFRLIMHYQNEETLEEILKYCESITEEIMSEDLSDGVIHTKPLSWKYPLYRIKGV